ncbi:MAG: tRNA(Ile)(2)-agmatinylcytidine synthase [Desulfurococcaceae archaeon]
MTEVHIGIDDVDSIQGGCTTHYAVSLAWRIKSQRVEFIDYLNLIRLNPSIPWKTRGNGAVAIRLRVVNSDTIEKLWSMVVETLEEYVSDLDDRKHQPTVIMHIGDIPDEYYWLSRRALSDLVPLETALKVANKYKASTRMHYLKGMRGIIGALASIGYTMRNTDYTYELIAYRRREYWGLPRQVDNDSVKEIDRLYGDNMILNYDYEVGKALITPRGPDPVLLGLRGENPFVLIEAFKRLKISEPVEYIALFRTNQHTDCHLRKVESIYDIKPYMCVIVKGYVSTKPRRVIGGHVFFKLCDDSHCIDIAVYEPSKSMRTIVEKLAIGDEIEVYGCTRPPSSAHGLTLNAEKINVLRLVELYVEENPHCPRCGARMESMGKNKGYRCKRCKYRDQSIIKLRIKVEREITPGIYQPPKRAFKHHMKPIERIGREKKSYEKIEIEDFIWRLT